MGHQRLTAAPNGRLSRSKCIPGRVRSSLENRAGNSLVANPQCATASRCDMLLQPDHIAASIDNNHLGRGLHPIEPDNIAEQVAGTEQLAEVRPAPPANVAKLR